MKACFYPDAQAYLRCFDLPGVESPIIYISGPGGAASAGYPDLIWGTRWRVSQYPA